MARQTNEVTKPDDLAGSSATLLLNWGLPITALIIAVLLDHPPKTMVWIAVLLWMGAACIINARRCGRMHCFYTGPFFLIMTIPVALHGFQVLWLGPEGWKWLGVALGIGGGGLWCLTERFFGRYA